MKAVYKESKEERCMLTFDVELFRSWKESGERIPESNCMRKNC